MADKQVQVEVNPAFERLTPTARGVVQAASVDLVERTAHRRVEASRARAAGVIKVAAGQGFYVESLTEELLEFGVELHHTYAGCEECLLGLMKGSFDLAGIHVPADDMCDPIVSAYQEHLDGMDLALIEVGTQRLGFMVAPWNPKNIFSIADLARPEVRFVNRQEGSGTRMLLDCLLCHQSVEPEMVAGFRDIEFTHEAVAAYVASGVADVGFGLETVARNFRLDFVPITNERYFFVCRHETPVSPEVDAMRVILRALGHSATAQILPTDVGLEALAEVFGLISNLSPGT